MFVCYAQQDDFPVLRGPYLGQKPPGLIPEIFAEGVMTTEFHEHSSPAFSPDGKEVYRGKRKKALKKGTPFPLPFFSFSFS